MSRRVERDLDACLTALAEGTLTLEECLARYPDNAAELRPLLELAIQLERLPAPQPDPAGVAKGHARMLAALERREEIRRRQWDLAKPARHRAVVMRRAAFALAVVIVVLTGGLIGEFLVAPGIARAARLESFEGFIEVLLPSENLWRVPHEGIRLPVGTRARTGPLAQARLTMGDAAYIDINAESELQILELRSRPSGRDLVAVMKQVGGTTTVGIDGGARRFLRFEIVTPHGPVRLAARRQGQVHVTVAVGEDGTVITVDQGTALVRVADLPIEVGPGETVSLPGAHSTPTPPVEEAGQPEPGQRATPGGDEFPSATPEARGEEERPDATRDRVTPGRGPTEGTDIPVPQGTAAGPTDGPAGGTPAAGAGPTPTGSPREGPGGSNPTQPGPGEGGCSDCGSPSPGAGSGGGDGTGGDGGAGGGSGSGGE